MNKKQRNAATERVRDFYDGPADKIYKTTWGENLHLGISPGEDSSHQDAMVHATKIMAALIPLDEGTSVLDLGSGYGGPARYLSSSFGCRVTGLNLSHVEIEEAEKRTKSLGLDSKITYVQGDFHELEFPEAAFDVVWSQDSLMYGADKRQILRETHRVLKPGGVLDFTDILASPDLEPTDRHRLYDRVRTPEMWDIERYLQELITLGFKIRRVEDWSEHVAMSYSSARTATLENRAKLESEVGPELVERTLDGLAFWVDMARKGNVGWALFVAAKP